MSLLVKLNALSPSLHVVEAPEISAHSEAQVSEAVFDTLSRELDGDSFSKRLKIDSSPPLGAKESSKGEGDDKAAVNAVDVKEDSIWDPSRESSPKRGDKASSRIR